MVKQHVISYILLACQASALEEVLTATVGIDNIDVLQLSAQEDTTDSTADDDDPDETAEDEPAPCSAQRTFVVFYDGTDSYLNKPCTWGPEGENLVDETTSSGLGQEVATNDASICESNVAALFRMSVQSTDRCAPQRTWYEPGVGAAGEANKDDNAQFGVGTKRHAENGYRWLCQNWQPDDKIMIFGLSRGALSSRMLQGMLGRVGCPPADAVEEALNVHFHGSKAELEEFRSGPNFREANVAFIGLLDAVLRTLIHPFKHRDIQKYHMDIKPNTKKLVHGLAFSEYRETFEAAEFLVPEGTEEEQVWFLGTHPDVGGGVADKGVPHIVLSWLADRGKESGLSLVDGWEKRLKMNVGGSVQTERALSLAWSSFPQIRNPGFCRVYTHGTNPPKIKLHESIALKRAANPGWVGLPECCPGIKEQMEKVFGYENVSNPTFDAAKDAIRAPTGPRWYEVTLGKLENVLAPEGALFGKPEFYAKVQMWASHGAPELKEGKIATKGCCPIRTSKTQTGLNRDRKCEKKKFGRCTKWAGPQRADADLSGVQFALPVESIAESLLIEVFEDDMKSDDFVGRAKIDMASLRGGGMTAHLDLDMGGTIEVQLKPLLNDEDAQPILGEGKAQCEWVVANTGYDLPDLCHGWDRSLLANTAGRLLGLTRGNSCADFEKDITNGAL